MPTTLVGLIIFLAFLTPGVLHYVQRRALVAEVELSPLVEAAALVTISLVANLVALGIFGAVRGVVPHHTPDVGSLLAPKSTYFRRHAAYVLEWAVPTLLLSSAIAITLARVEPLRRVVTARFSPVIFDHSAWYEVFEEAPDGKYAYLGVVLHGGAYIGGRLAWYSTESVESGDRDIVLAQPLSRRVDDDEVEMADVERVIVSAREISTLMVSYVDEE